jgi:hypothetical protein
LAQAIVDGDVTSIDVPSASHTWIMGIDAHGRVAGNYLDSNARVHGFVRDKDGDITTIDVHGAAHTNVVAMSQQGDITGVWIDANGDSHGFVVSHEANDKEK